MDVIYPRCAGLDVHKSPALAKAGESVVACVRAWRRAAQSPGRSAEARCSPDLNNRTRAPPIVQGR